MKRTNTAEFKETVFQYLADSAYDFEGSQAETAQHIRNRFESEFNYPDNKRRTPNNQARVAAWLSGLPLNIAAYYVDIIALAETWHECQLTDKQADVICENWFNFLAFKLIQLWAKHGVEGL